MSKKRRTFSNEFKAKVALEAIREQETIQQIAIRHQISPVQVSQWKKQALDNLSHTFGQKAAAADTGERWQRREAHLFRKIGQLEVERDWLKKKSAELGLPTGPEAFYD